MLFRYVVIDLSAGPCTYGKIEAEEGSVSFRTLPRLRNVMLPRGSGVDSHHSTHEIFIGQLSALISTTIEHVIAPDVRYCRHLMVHWLICYFLLLGRLFYYYARESYSRHHILSWFYFKMRPRKSINKINPTLETIFGVIQCFYVSSLRYSVLYIFFFEQHPQSSTLSKVFKLNPSISCLYRPLGCLLYLYYHDY